MALVRSLPQQVVMAALLALSITASAQSPATTDSAKAESTTSTTQKPMTAEEKRKADLQADTERLYKLTQELKEAVDKSNKDTLSVTVVKKAQEVERLAKSIKERSRNP